MTAPRRTSDLIPSQAGFKGTFLAGILILGFCVWNYWYLILETNDRVPTDLEVVIPQLAEVQLYENEIRVGVYDSAATRMHYRQMRFDYGSVLSSWKDFLENMGLAYDPFLKIENISDYDIVILPFTACLSDYEARVIKEYVGNGGRLFMTGTVGSRFEDGDWRDEPVFGDIVGARFVGNANPSPKGPARLSLNRDLPVSLRWTPRRSLVIPSYNEVLVIRPIGSRMNIVAKAPYYRRDETYDELVAICYGPYLKGEIVWSGVRIAAAPSGDETAERAFRELFVNMMVWLADRPRVTTSTWPEKKKGALGLVVEFPEKSPLRLLSKIQKTEQPIGVLVSPQQANQLVDLPGVDQLDVEWILHLDPAFLKSNEFEEMGAKLRSLKARVEKTLNTTLSGVMVDGMRPRDMASIALDAGFVYLLSPPTDGIEEYPEIFASVRRKGPFEAPEVLSLAPFREKLPEQISPTDCFFVVLPAEDFLELKTPLKFTGLDDQKELWKAFPREIVNWRSDRNSVVMDEEFLPNDRLRLRISNGSYTEFHQFPFSIGFGGSIEKVLIWPKAVGQPPPDLVSKKNGDWHFSIDRFRPGMTLEFIFTPLKEGETPSNF
ncbi:hypothetical protein J3R74_001109 [Puniceicoccus vermicola]|uniref:Beta-galactosidase trimerization domain-containing protein n=1 Tax=Puniceicoccus vermicola TaxID=388746 RepID=A0A7X1E4F1_9BACT|nr:beta-galactosidase trimerization domain-containing protein [Puniceicoccus vermicola]